MCRCRDPGSLGYSNSKRPCTTNIGTVSNVPRFFKYYHSFLPLLDPQKGPEEYLHRSSLLAWTIVCVASRRAPSEPGLLSSLSGPFSRLLWSTITCVPQDYHVVKALCLLCTWPLPTTSQRTDATFMLSGLMMQIAMQLGLHRPVQAEEFTTFCMEVQGEAMKDRLQTWVICNIVAQKYVPFIPIGLSRSLLTNW